MSDEEIVEILIHIGKITDENAAFFSKEKLLQQDSIKKSKGRIKRLLKELSQKPLEIEGKIFEID